MLPPQIVYFYGSNNFFTGISPLGELVRLDTFDISHNNLSGDYATVFSQFPINAPNTGNCLRSMYLLFFFIYFFSFFYLPIYLS